MINKFFSNIILAIITWTEGLPGVSTQISTGEVITIIVLFLTALITCYYVRITRGLWKESVHNTNLQVAPLLVVCQGKRVFILKNIGKGPAFDIKVEDFNLHFFDDLFSKKVKEYRLKFEYINYLEAGEEAELKTETSENGQFVTAVTQAGVDIMLSPSSERSIPMTITYRDSLGQSRFSVVLFGKDNFRIKKISEHITWRYYLVKWVCNLKDRVQIFFFRCRKNKEKTEQ